MKTLIVLSLSLSAVGALNATTERVNLDKAWAFSRNGEVKTRIVDLPHDWSIEGAPTDGAPTGKEWGFYPAGNATYVRTFELAEADLAANLELVFDGVFRAAEVSVNGGESVKGSRYGYTGFRVPLAGRVKAGQNTVSVRARNDALPGSRWYMGSGIYRSVWLEKHTGEYLVPGSLDVRTLEIAPESATVRISGTVTNVAGGAAKDVARSFRYDRPRFWTPETPDLYAEDFCGEKVRFGIRTVSADAKRGFLLNGKPVELHGACVHHDHGPLGAASWPEAERRKALQLKRAGFNAVRTSHNPVSEEFLSACDEIGLLVVDDLFDGRERAKTRGDYCEVFREDWRKDLDWVVRRDRVHPSVVMWSVGNEVLERSEPRAAETTRKMHGFIDRLDGTRPVTQALCLWGREKWEDQDAMAAALDVVGYNYLEHLTEGDHRRLPGRVILYTETYPKDAAMVWKRILEHPYVIGEFVWTGIDYLGETGIGRSFYTDREKWGEHYHNVPQFPWHGAYCGDIDLAGTRKPISHYRETLWNAKAKTYLAVREPDGWKGKVRTTAWSVWPTCDHWTFPGWEGKAITAEVYSRAARVRLTLNGKPVAEKPNGADNAYLVSFDLAYASGTLLAEGLDAGGKVVDRSELRTAGKPDRVRRTEETIGRLTWVTAEVVDADGTVCPHADMEIDFGPKAIATCSGDLSDNVPAPSSKRKAWQGRALGVLLNPAAPADFHEWAPTPPMGWNSWDCYGSVVDEAACKSNADVLAEKLLPFGYDTCVVDIRWTVQNEVGANYNQKDPIYTLDEWGRYLPDPKRFPSSVDGRGFKPLADYVHAKGLKFGIHIMRGVPKEAVAKKLPVKGTDGITCDRITNGKTECVWLRDNCTVLKDRAGAQAYYDSILELYASWGVDFIKCDDLSAPRYHQDEVEMLRKAIDRCGRKILLSTSPGETPLAAAEHVGRHANMWRMVNDMWDKWRHLAHLTPVACDWLRRPPVPGAYPDCDMIPLGKLCVKGYRGARMTNLTKDEQVYLMTLFAIARSPLFVGSDLPSIRDDAWTLGLLTNRAVLKLHREGREIRVIRCDKEGAEIRAKDAEGNLYRAVFNMTEAPVEVKSVSGATDVWSGQPVGESVTIPPHGAILLSI